MYTGEYLMPDYQLKCASCGATVNIEQIQVEGTVRKGG